MVETLVELYIKMNIGDKVSCRGDIVTITTAPYKEFGGMWVDAVTESGLIVSIPTKEQVALNNARNKKVFDDQQTGFAKLRELTESNK